MGKKFFVVGSIAFLLTGFSLFFQEKNFAEAKEGERQPFTFLTEAPKDFVKFEKESFVIDAAKLSQPVIFKLFGEDLFEVFPGAKIAGAFFQNPLDPDFPKTALQIKQGKFAAFRFSSLPETQISVGNNLILQGKGVVIANANGGRESIEVARYPVMVGEARNGKSLTWRSFFEPTLSLRLILPPSTPSDELVSFLKQDEAFRKEKITSLEKEIQNRGFHYSDPKGLTFSLTKWTFGLANLFSLRKDFEKERSERFISELISDAAFELLLKNPDQAKERLTASSIPRSILEKGSVVKRFTFPAADHPWKLLDRELRGFAIGSVSMDDPKTRDFAFELLQSGITLFYDESEKKRGALIAFGEELKKQNAQIGLRLFEPFFREKGGTSDFFDPLYLKTLVTVQDAIKAIKDEDFLKTRKELFEIGKTLLEEEKISLASGRDSLLLLLSEMGAERDEMLQAHGSLITFLFAPEAEEDKKFREQYQAFLNRDKEAEKIQKIIEGEKPEVKLRTAAGYESEAEADFIKEGLELIAFISSESDPRYLIIKEARFASITFQGVYDVSQKLFISLEVNGETYERSIAIQNVKPFLLVVGGIQAVIGTEISGPEAEEALPEAAETSKVERVLKAKVFEKLDLLNITYEGKNILIKDVERQMFSVVDASFRLDSGEVIKVSFEFLNETNEIQNVEFEGPDETPLKIVEKFKLSDLKERVELLYNKAKLDKEREESSQGNQGEVL